MSEDNTTAPSNAKLIGRVSAIILLTLAVAYGLGGSAIEYAFSSDPLGPRVFPVALAVILAVLAVLYILSPGSAEGFPEGRLLIKVLAVPALVLVATLLFEPAGFAISVFVLTLGSGLLFGASLKTAVIGAFGHALLWWFVFSFILEVYLPSGAVFGG